MANTAKRSRARRLGEWAGRGWNGLSRLDHHVAAWLAAQGLSEDATKVVWWGAKLLVLVALLYAAFWLVLLFVLALAATWIAFRIDRSPSVDTPFNDESDHKDKLFYDPVNYNDDPDPRFDDK